MHSPRKTKALLLTGLSLLLASVFYWNWLDRTNAPFQTFQQDSARLAHTAFEAGRQGLELPVFGLAESRVLEFAPVQPPGFEAGFHPSLPQIAFAQNIHAQKYLQPGYTLVLPDGREHTIAQVQPWQEGLVVTLQGPASVYSQANANALGFRIVLPDGSNAPWLTLDVYKSQVGLQGKIYYQLGRHVPFATLPRLQAVNTLAFAALLSVLCLGIARQYTPLLGGCFYVAFVLSPWMVNFARNLYWLPVLWFLPMAVGLFCPLGRGRFVCYGLAFVTLLLKCLCGYEYLSTILLGLVLFPIARWWAEGDLALKKRHLQNLLLLGLCGLGGFLAAAGLHVLLLGGGNPLSGLDFLWNQVVEKRTYSAPKGRFEEKLEQSLQAGTVQTVLAYFRFPGPVLAGVPGFWFLPLALLPLLLRDKTEDARILALWVTSLAATLSWLVLAKSHSYDHQHINYVLWYFGFVPLCLYIPLRRLANAAAKHWPAP